MRIGRLASVDLSDEQLRFLAGEGERLGKDVPEMLSEIVQAYIGTHKELTASFDSVMANSGRDLTSSQASLFPKRRGKRMLPFGWYGGKYSHLEWLLPQLPEAHHFCEPFAGSAVVTLNRQPAPVETINDIDGELTNFFRVLRDDRERLISAILLTPFSREELTRAVEEALDSLSPLERARRFFVRARQVRTGLAQTASEGRWATCRNTSRAGMSGAVSRWLGSVASLWDVAERLMRVQIESRPAIQVIHQYDSPETLFYCDPPYPHQARSDKSAYAFEMSDTEHRDLASTLASIKGKAAVSGYACALMEELYPDWRVIQAPTKKCHSAKTPRTEVVWVNY